MLKCFRRELSNYLREDLRIKAGRYFEVYIFEDSEVTHCCEITPSYEGWPVTFYTDNDLSEVDYDKLQEEFCLEPIYIHCAEVERSATVLEYPFGHDQFETRDEYLQEVIEYFRCNSFLVEALI